MFKKLALVAAIATGMTVPLAHAGALGGVQGQVKFEFGNLDAGTTGYTNAYDPLGTNTQVICNTVALCNNVSGLTPGFGAIGGEDSWGILSVSRIVTDNAAATTLWQAGEGGDWLSGIFYGIEDRFVSVAAELDENGDPTGTLLTRAFGVGGGVKIYRQAPNTYDGSGGGVARTGIDTYPGINEGELWLELEFVLGATASAQGQQSTYFSQFSTTNLAGNSEGFLRVVGGAAAERFDTNGFTTFAGQSADFYLTTTYDNINGLTNWTVSSVGQVKANAVPEPSGLALAGLALLGAGIVRRRSVRVAK